MVIGARQVGPTVCSADAATDLGLRSRDILLDASLNLCLVLHDVDYFLYYLLNHYPSNNVTSPASA